MASLENRNGNYRVVFMYAGRKYGYSLDTSSKDDAEALRGGVEKTLMRLEQNLIELPADADIVAFIKADGRMPEKPQPAQRIYLKALCDKYEEAHGIGAMEANSLQTVRMHLRHVRTTLGDRYHAQELTLADLQSHVNRRAQKQYRGKPLSAYTLRKEISTLRACWNWGVHAGLVKGPFPSRGLKYPKYDEKPPFMTWQEAERFITDGMTEAKRAEIWDSLYLTQQELSELLAFVQQHTAHSWIFPVVCFAAHTGARRSEILRVLVNDVDFQGMTVLLREKKRSRTQRTSRRVPLTPFLAGVLKDWLKVHPGGPFLFCHEGEVPRSKKRSRTTGYKGDKTRESSQKGRMATVRKRQLPSLGALTKDELHDHFKRTLANSKWKVLRGWHVFRHSFISLAASRGVDQRLIDEWVGHQTEEQRKRYRHLLPSVQQQAISSMFET